MKANICFCQFAIKKMLAKTRSMHFASCPFGTRVGGCKACSFICKETKKGYIQKQYYSFYVFVCVHRKIIMLPQLQRVLY